jgi:glycosyltransferase involved in cell wall biosynthesis
MIPTFNCAQYLAAALRSVLAQAPDPDQMQIEVVDDCSTDDDPEAVVRELGKGRVLFHRNRENMGMGRNFNICISRSRGYLIHLLNGDDYVAPLFYKKMAGAADESRDCAAIFCRSFIIDTKQNLQDVTKFCCSLKRSSRNALEFFMANPIRTPGVIVRRSFYEKNGGFDTTLLHVLDWEMWVRAIVYGAARMLDEPLAYYRVHDENDTTRATRMAINLQDQLRLSAKWQAERLSGFNHFLFDRETTRVAAVRALLYFMHGDREAAEANWRVWRDHARPTQIPKAFIDTVRAVGSAAAHGARNALTVADDRLKHTNPKE